LPEGAEVRHMSIKMAHRLTGRVLEEIEVVSGKYTKKEIEGLESFNSVTPQTIRGVGVHGKFLYVLLNNQWSIWSTLGMSGSWSEEESKHTRIKFILNDGTYYYNDTRNFGTLKITNGKDPIIKKLESLGPDLLSEECSDELFIERIRSVNNRTIAQAIMDQSVVAGVGNYVKAESLYLSKISPHTKCKDLSDKKLSLLNRATRAVLTQAFEVGGLKEDTTQKLSVYGQKEDPDGNEIVREKTKDGRTTHWVPAVQK